MNVLDGTLARIGHSTRLRSPSKMATQLRGQVEVNEHGQDDDPFAKVHGLV